MPEVAILDSPLAGAEFLAVDTETNGQPKERCELTEVGAVLVGGGELHDRWSSLVGVSEPLGRGIQRFTGITQTMVDEAPPPEQVLPELAEQLRGRILVAHSARFDVGVLKQAFERAELEWPDPPVMCTVALARRLAPLQRRRGLASLADALGIEVAATHRALPDAETCARVLCALLPRLCANARTVGEALALLRPRRPARPKLPKMTRGRDDRPDLSALPKDPGVYIFRDADGRPLYVGKSICLRTRARAHFTTPSTWTGQAEHVDYQPTESELGALVLENRLIKALKPLGNTQLKKEADGYVYLRCRLDIPFPILEVARAPAAGHAVCVGPVRGRAAAAELVEQLNSLFGLRHCGRALVTRQHPSAYGQMGRCLSPCLGDLDPNLYRERLDQALALFEVDGGAALLAHVEAQMRSAAAAQRYERAAWLRRRARRLESLLGRLGGVLRAAHAGSRLVLAPHPAAPGRADAFWIVAGRIADWGPLPADMDELAARTSAALAAAPGAGLGGWLPAEELDEARIVGSWLAGHEDAPVLELDRRPDERALGALVNGLGGEEPVRPRRPAAIA
jgi:DNA polymerase-3 subunit epsilon